jgi:hypothetical protein
MAVGSVASATAPLMRREPRDAEASRPALENALGFDQRSEHRAVGMSSGQSSADASIHPQGTRASQTIIDAQTGLLPELRVIFTI